jgi:vitamin B12 transporter
MSNGLLDIRRLLSAIRSISLSVIMAISTPSLMLSFQQSAKVSTTADVVITASRIPTSTKALSQLVPVLTAQDLKTVPARSVEEAMENFSGIDVRQRGPLGVQSDISIRGGTFEQTLVMINGIKVNDIQTGHHNMNIPFTMDNIERIEIVKGPASRQYGPNAFTGAVNIITKNSFDYTAKASLMTGQYGLWEATLTASVPSTNIRNTVSVMRRKSDGFREFTDFRIDMASATFGTDFGAESRHSIDAVVSYVEKDFGANGFYALTFPTQFENTQTLFAGITAKINTILPLVVKSSYRRNRDYFLLRREDPGFYANLHFTNVANLEVSSLVEWSGGTTSFGVEIASESIDSKSQDRSTRQALGEHSRLRTSTFVEHRFMPIENVTVEGGASLVHYSDWGTNIAPGIALGWQATDAVRIFASVGQSFRVPTFTDLYYNDRVTIGNPNLRPETAWTYEAGIGLTDGILSLQAAIFQRNARNLIDYIGNPTVQASSVAGNFSAVVTQGFDAQATLQLSYGVFEKITAGFTHINQTFTIDEIPPPFAGNPSDIRSRYGLDQLRNQSALALYFDWGAHITQTIRVRHEQRMSLPDWYVFSDSRLLWRGLRFNAVSIEVFGEITNIFNQQSVDFVGLSLPGRWVRGGFAVAL